MRQLILETTVHSWARKHRARATFSGAPAVAKTRVSAKVWSGLGVHLRCVSGGGRAHVSVKKASTRVPNQNMHPIPGSFIAVEATVTVVNQLIQVLGNTLATYATAHDQKANFWNSRRRVAT